ncbi:pantetheine-phosphate adenylyltransferase [Paenibacillus puldeungensis]|uniref:Phosphopantetheine adenylyltransferase n=1 Tax=Paenibacillus puldeungensis TaxID=696536 RepID=A0ABW3RWW0_9BACL
MKAIYPGSFDPFTLGHLGILERAAKLFDHIDVVIANNRSKKYMFNPEQRLNIAKMSVAHLGEAIRVKCYSGLVVDYIRDEQIDMIIRGIRGSADLDYEIKLEHFNSLASNAGTVYFTPKTEQMSTSSSLVRMFIDTHNMHLISNYMVPEAVEYINSLDLWKER